MSLGRLRTFIEVYRQRSLTAAARALHLTQPAVSQHIAGLEEAIGRSLFLRESTGVFPTAAADELAADIGDKLDVAEAALASARARSEEVAGSIQIIGHADFLSEVVAPRLVPLLQAGMKVRLQAGGGDMTKHMLVEGHCDLGITAFASEDKRLRCELMRTEPVLAVAAPAVVARLQAARDLGDALAAEQRLAARHAKPCTDWARPENAQKLAGQRFWVVRLAALPVRGCLRQRDADGGPCARGAYVAQVLSSVVRQRFAQEPGGPCTANYSVEHGSLRA